MSLIPLVYLVVRAGDAGASRVLSEVLTGRVLALTARSLALAGVVTAASLVLGVGSALLVTRTRLPFRRGLAALAVLPLAVPSYVAAYTWVSVADLAGVQRFEGFWAAALVLTLYTSPYLFLPVAASLTGADPAHEEVARSLGRTPWQTFRQVTWPQLRPAVVSGSLLVALYVLADFGAVSILRVDTFTRAIFTAFSAGFDRVGAVALSSVLLLLTVVLIRLGAGRGDDRARYSRGSAARRVGLLDLGRWRLPALGFQLLVAALALGVPTVSFLRWFGAGVSRPGALGEVAAAAGATLALASAGALVTVALALPLGLLVARTPSFVTRGLERTAYLAHALPGVVVGLSLVFFGIHVAYPLYQTVWLVALAYATLFLPLAVGAVAASAAQAPRGVEDVARSLGARPSGVFGRVTLPLVLPGVGTGAALVLLTAMKELPATLMLRPTGLDTLATRLWTHTAVEAYAAAAPYAALLVALASVPTWLLVSGSGTVRSEP